MPDSALLTHTNGGDLRSLRSLAVKCRRELERSDWEGRCFPGECCGDAAEALWDSLREGGFDAVLLEGKVDGRDHAWVGLRGSGTQVDISGDQFLNIPPVHIFQVDRRYVLDPGFEAWREV